MEAILQEAVQFLRAFIPLSRSEKFKWSMRFTVVGWICYAYNGQIREFASYILRYRENNMENLPAVGLLAILVLICLFYLIVMLNIIVADKPEPIVMVKEEELVPADVLDNLMENIYQAEKHGAKAALLANMAR